MSYKIHISSVATVAGINNKKPRNQDFKGLPPIVEVDKEVGGGLQAEKNETAT